MHLFPVSGASCQATGKCPQDFIERTESGAAKWSYQFSSLLPYGKAA